MMNFLPLPFCGVRAALGPPNTKDASANAVIEAQGKARCAAKTIRLGEARNATLRPNDHVPEGLFFF